MNSSSPPMFDSMSTGAITQTVQQLPVPVPEWSRARQVWHGCWPTHVYGFGCAFLLAAALSLASPPYCFRCRRTTLPTSTVNGIVGVVCFARSCVLFIDAYHSTGLLPVALVQLVHGLVFPGVVSTLTILDRVFSALVKPRQQLGSIKHPRLIATALSVYLLSTLVAHTVIAVKPQTRLWLLLCQAVSLTWGCAAVFLVACQCLRLSRYASLTARSRRQTAMYIRAKRHVEQRLDASPDCSQQRHELLRDLARLRVARTKADEFTQQQQRISSLNEQTVSDAELQLDTSSTSDSCSDHMPSDLRVTKTTTVKLSSRNHFRYHRRSRRRRRVTGSSSATYGGGSEAVRDFTVTALAAARLLWSPSPESDGGCDESPSWHVCLHTTDNPGDVEHTCVCADKRRRKPPHDATTQLDRRTSVTGTDSDNDDVDNDREETDSSSENGQRPRTDTANTYACANLQNISETGGHCGSGVPTRSNEPPACRHQSEPTTSFGGSRRASSRTCLLLDNASDQAARPTLPWRPLSWRLKSGTARLLREVIARWRKSRNATSTPPTDEPSRRIACVAESYRLDATCSYASRLLDVESGPKSSLTSDRRRQRSSTYDAVVFENRAYSNSRSDVVAGCDAAVDIVLPETSAQIAPPVLGMADDCRQASSGYLADTELDNVDWKHDLDVTSTTSSLQLPVSSIYLGLSRLRGGRTVRVVWRTASAAVTSACFVCCLHIYSMLGVFGVLSNDRPASAWPWLAFQTLYRFSELVYFYALLAVTWSLQQRRMRRRHVTS